MNKFGILRTLNKELKYKPIEEYIGAEIPLDISRKAEVLAEEIKSLIKEYMNFNAVLTDWNNIEGTIAKYGMLDLCFEIKHEIVFNSNNGLQILRENYWVDKDEVEDTENYKQFREEGLGLLEDMVEDIREQKTYLRIFATTATNRESKWLRKKRYLMMQMMKSKKINPLSEDKIQVFRVDDMCLTNCPNIWFHKHFYM